VEESSLAEFPDSLTQQHRGRGDSPRSGPRVVGAFVQERPSGPAPSSGAGQRMRKRGSTVFLKYLHLRKQSLSNRPARNAGTSIWSGENQGEGPARTSPTFFSLDNLTKRACARHAEGPDHLVGSTPGRGWAEKGKGPGCVDVALPRRPRWPRSRTTSG